MTDHKDSNTLADRLKRESDTMSKRPPRYKMIHKVHPSLRTVKGKEYEPVLVSIGPYHHGSQNLQEMQKYKERTLVLLQATTNHKLEDYAAAMRKIEDEARTHYTSDIGMDRDKFIDMMILDGCFILEFLRKLKGFNRDKTFFDTVIFLPDIIRDFVLFENQLPLFVLSDLFDMTKDKDEEENFADLIKELVDHFFFQYFGAKDKEVPRVDSDEIKKSPHLLHLVYMACKDCMWTKETHKIGLAEVAKQFDNVAAGKNNFPFITSATTLEQTGVKFEKAKQDAKLCDITFAKNGVLKIPELMITDRTECYFRNLVAYEQYIKVYDVTDYLAFMDCLINSPKDVELLRHSGIIVNMLGDDKFVSIMFNKICAFVVYKMSTSKFQSLCEEINKYSTNPIHVWMAKLWREYFNSPWSLISFFAALLLLGLTIVQTTFSVISYTNPK